MMCTENSNNVDSIKQNILGIHKKWIALGESPEDIESASCMENEVINLISGYCEIKGYKSDGYQRFQQTSKCRKDYHSNKTNIICLDTIASKQLEVFDLKYFYVTTFWPEYNLSEIQFRNGLINYIAANK